MKDFTVEHKEVAGYNGEYEVARDGRVWSNKSNKYLKAYSDGRGYNKVSLSKFGEAKSYRVHRLVAEAFITKIDNKDYINHKDGITTNNVVDNLEWVDQSENTLDGLVRTGRKNNRCKYLVQMTEAREIVQYFEGPSIAAKVLGFNAHNIGFAANNNTKYYGCYWVYVSPEELSLMGKIEISKTC